MEFITDFLEILKSKVRGGELRKLTEVFVLFKQLLSSLF